MTRRAVCRCGWEYVALLGGLVPVHPRGDAPTELCPRSMQAATASAPVRDRDSTVAHLRAVEPSVAAHVFDEPERQRRDASPEARDALDAAWALHRARRARAVPILDALNAHARKFGLRDWRHR